MADNPTHWQLDRKVPVAIVLTLVAQFAFGVYWVSSTSFRIQAIEEHSMRTEQQNRELVVIVADIREGLAAIRGALDVTYRGQFTQPNRTTIQNQQRSTGGTSGSG